MMMRLMTALALLRLLTFAALGESLPNTLTDEEKNNGWTFLFDGNSTDGWRGLHRQDVPKCWQVVNGELVVNGAGVSDDQGDLITKQQFGDFELCWEWKIPADGNSGVKYYVLEELSSGSAGIGLESSLSSLSQA